MTRLAWASIGRAATVALCLLSARDLLHVCRLGVDLGSGGFWVLWAAGASALAWRAWALASVGTAGT